MKRIGELEACATKLERRLHLFGILHGNSREGDQVAQALQRLRCRLLGDCPQHPGELENNGLRNEDVAGFEHAPSDARLGPVIGEVIAGKDVGINRAHA